MCIFGADRVWKSMQNAWNEQYEYLIYNFAILRITSLPQFIN